MNPPPAVDDLLEGIDLGIEAHLAWNRKLLRCALLREPPGDEMLAPDAQGICRLGAWFAAARERLDRHDARGAALADAAHLRMHDAVRSLCGDVLAGCAARAADLEAFEAAQAELVHLLTALRGKVAEAAGHVDALTGLPLRHNLAAIYDLRRRDAARQGLSLWVAIADIDHFKAVNDAHGHAAGDAVLRRVAGILAGCLRDTDHLCRYGGEEFLALVLARDAAGAAGLAERMVEAMRETPIATGTGATLRLTVTVGLAPAAAGDSLEAASARADRALYRGKALGRDRAVLAAD